MTKEREKAKEEFAKWVDNVPLVKPKEPLLETIRKMREERDKKIKRTAKEIDYTDEPMVIGEEVDILPSPEELKRYINSPTPRTCF